MNKIENKLTFYGGPLVGFLPTIIYMAISMILAFNFQYYSINSVAYGGLIGIVLTSFLAKRQGAYWSAIAESLQSHAKNFLLFLFLGIFITFLTRGALGEGFVWLSQQLGIEGGMFIVLSFLASALLAMGTGAPLMGMLTALPLFYPVGNLLGAEPVLLMGGIISGSFFGDHISPSSQVTIISAQTQSENGKTAEPTAVIKARALYAAGAAIISLVFFAIFGSSGGQGGDASIITEMSNAAGLWMLIPLVVLLVICFRTKNVIHGLALAIVTAAVVGMLTGLFSFADFLYFEQETGEVAGLIPDGIFNLGSFVISLIFLYSLIEIMNKSGSFQVIADWLSSTSFLEKPIGVELIVALLVVLVTVLLSGMVLPAILIVSPLMQELGQKAKISPVRRTNIMILASSSISAIIPLTSVFVNGAISTIQNLQAQYEFIEPVDPFSLFVSSIYNWLMLLVLIGWIFLGLNRNKRSVGSD